MLLHIHYEYVTNNIFITWKIDVRTRVYTLSEKQNKDRRKREYHKCL